MTAVVLVLVIFCASFFQLGEMRPLTTTPAEMRPLNANLLILRQSLQKGPVRGSGPNPCTNIGGRNPGSCTRAAVGSMNFAGNVFVRPPPPPVVVVAADK
ncbi:hypothetical protein LINGRAHAP2_LOCUS19662 [Linum grandiflorum]